MPTNLQLTEDINENPQPVLDEAGHPSALLIASGNVQVVGSPPHLGCHFQFGNSQLDTEPGVPSAKLTFAGWGVQHAGFFWTPRLRIEEVPSSLTLAFGPNDDPNENTHQFIFNADGSVAFLGLGRGLQPGQSTELIINSEGNITPDISSLRFKEQVEPLNDDFQKILALQPKSFRRKDTGVRGIGYAAEELDELELNSLVVYDTDGKPLTINYRLIPIYLLEVLKEQQKIIQELQAQVAELKTSRKELHS